MPHCIRNQESPRLQEVQLWKGSTELAIRVGLRTGLRTDPTRFPSDAHLLRCRCSRGALITGINVALLTYMVCTTFQSPFGAPSREAKPSTRRTLRTAQQQQQQQQQQQELQQSLGPAEETFVVGDAHAESYFQPWIQQDFALWEQGGIKMVRSCVSSPDAQYLSLRNPTQGADAAVCCVRCRVR